MMTHGKNRPSWMLGPVWVLAFGLGWTMGSHRPRTSQEMRRFMEYQRTENQKRLELFRSVSNQLGGVSNEIRKLEFKLVVPRQRHDEHGTIIGP